MTPAAPATNTRMMAPFPAFIAFAISDKARPPPVTPAGNCPTPTRPPRHLHPPPQRGRCPIGFPLPAWRDPLKGEEFSDGRVTQEVRQGFPGGRGAAGPGDG